LKISQSESSMLCAFSLIWNILALILSFNSKFAGGLSCFFLFLLS
jgi:hypothetical protein